MYVAEKAVPTKINITIDYGFLLGLLNTSTLTFCAHKSYLYCR